MTTSKTIGLLGGMSWESTALYYRLINEQFKERLGGLHSARIALVSVDFHDVEQLQAADRWTEAGELLASAARQVEAAGADFLVLCTNTMHRVADVLEGAISIPLLHLADATAVQIKRQGINTVGLLGTRFTMEQDFYRGRLAERHGLRVVTPDREDRNLVHDIIYSQLCRGVVNDASRAQFLRIIDDLHQRGAEAVIQGCTEIAMLVEQRHSDVHLFDTTAIHARAAVEAALDSG